MNGAPEAEGEAEAQAAAEGAELAGEEAGDDGQSEGDDLEERSVDAPVSRRRFAPVLLVGGLIVALLVGRQAMPTARTVVVRLEGDRADVRTVQMAVGHLADAEDDVSSVQWRFEAGSPPPPVLRKELKLAPGQHRFRLEVERHGGSQAQTTRIVDVTDEEVTIRVPTH